MVDFLEEEAILVVADHGRSLGGIDVHLHLCLCRSRKREAEKGAEENGFMVEYVHNTVMIIQQKRQTETEGFSLSVFRLP